MASLRQGTAILHTIFSAWHHSCLFIPVGPLSGRPLAYRGNGDRMFITVLVTICLNLAVPGTCVTEPVVNSNQDQVSVPGCLGLEGFESAKEFWEHHPLYHSWQLKGWACQIGNRAPPEKRKA